MISFVSSKGFDPVVVASYLDRLPLLLLRIVQSLVTLAVVLIASNIIYNLFLHPLRSFPGPKLWAASRLPYVKANLKGRLIYNTLELHERYGPVVRIGPEELSYTTATAMKTIYGNRPQGEMPKAVGGHGHPPPGNGVHAVLTHPVKEEHARMRKAIAPAFSDKSLREQERALQLYTGLLIEKLRQNCSQPLNMVNWYNFTTFDMIGDLAFSEPFGCLETGAYVEWISFILNSTQAIPLAQTIVYYGLQLFSSYIIPKRIRDGKASHQRLSLEKLQRRQVKGVLEDRPDFMTHIIKHNDGALLTPQELQTMAVILIVGGSETTAALLSAATFYLATNRRVYENLTREIRTAFRNEDEITMVSVNELKYLLAVLEESLRIFPPSPASFPRVVPRAGEVIDGTFVPGGTVVGVHGYSAAHSSRNFTRPNDFVPERWLPETEKDREEFANDNKGAAQPFSIGPRNCIGRNLAFAEMKLIMARILWNFDLQLAASSDAWKKQQKCYLIWQKDPLMVKLTPVR